MVQKRNSYEVLIVDTGNKGVLNSSKLLELLIKHDEMLESVINNISMPSGYLKSEGRLTQNTIERMRASWKDLYTGGKNASKTIRECYECEESQRRGRGKKKSVRRGDGECFF